MEFLVKKNLNLFKLITNEENYCNNLFILKIEEVQMKKKKENSVLLGFETKNFYHTGVEKKGNIVLQMFIYAHASIFRWF